MMKFCAQFNGMGNWQLKLTIAVEIGGFRLKGLSQHG
jgi:hypothetical protein